jgi:hypothetical protein
MPRPTSKQLNISMPTTIYEQIQKSAEKDSRTVSNWIVMVVKQFLDREDDKW